MLRVELFTVEPVSPRCSIYLRRLCMFAASQAGARYSQRKYFHTSHHEIAAKMTIHRPAASKNSTQMRRRKSFFRIVEPAPQKRPDEKKRRVQQADSEFENGGQDSGPAGHCGLHERPEFLVPLGRKVRMMRLMHHPVEAEAHEAEGSDNRAIYFI